jgi:predicted kinase
LQSQSRYVTTTAAAVVAAVPGALPARPATAAGEAPPARPVLPRVRDLRGRAGSGPLAVCFAEGDVVVVSGLPGSGKSTLIKRTATAAPAIDSQDVRERWERRLPTFLPYALYRPLVRLSHYRGLRRTLRSGAGVIVHDCGSLSWVRRWLAREARRRGSELHLVLLDVTPEAALAGQASRGRGVSGQAFTRHRRAVTRLVQDAESGRLPVGCASALLLDRGSAGTLQSLGFA